MSKTLMRRKALKNTARAAAAALLPSSAVYAQQSWLQIAGRPVELKVTAISPQTVRISLQVIENGQTSSIPSNGSLVTESWGMSAARIRNLSRPRSVKCGDLTVKLSANPPSGGAEQPPGSGTHD
jgi:hypothetical protein